MAPFVETAEEQQDEELGPLPKCRHLRSKAKDAELPGLTSGYLGSPVVSIYSIEKCVMQIAPTHVHAHM